MNSKPEKSISTLEKALLALKDARAKLETYEGTRKEPIAIIGMGCRFPGGASNTETFWDLLAGSRDAIGPVPADRWDLEAYYDPNPETPGKMYAREGGFIEQLQEFDPEFFGISVREAIFLDPQQRLLLEVSWEALENAGQNPQQLAESKTGAKTGVFIGICSNDYMQQIYRLGPDIIDAYLARGNTHSTASGRISYLLGLTGPNLAVDTACSSSLVSVHLACGSLRNRESDLAIAGGVNRLLSPELSIDFCKARMLSADSRCKTFDSAADGFARGEGCGIIILKRLSDAVADGDNILAVIRGTAINQDGHTSGLTVPSGPSQQAVIRQALENSGISPANISYIEAHGTGTSLGDPIEMGALGAVFGESHSPEQPLLVGSVKTNIGHLEGAAGIAGLLKVLLQLQHKKIAPHLHFHHPNPYINWSELPVQVPTQVTPWQSKGSRIAGVSSFGFSGTNAHVILEEAPTQVKSEGEFQRPLHLFTLSAKTPTALDELVTRYHHHLETHRALELADICYTANTGRAQFNHRLGIIASSQEELTEKLLLHQAREEVTGVFSGSPDSTTSAKIAFLFTGQGSQYVNMGRELYQTQPVFREILDQCDTILRSELERPLLEVLYPQKPDGSSSSLLDQTVYTQPALFAIEYALCKLWQSWGIKPDVVMGHSVGEYVAACVAGVFSLEDGLKFIAGRGRLMQQLPPGGQMVAVMASAEKVRSLINDDGEKVAIAAINGPENTVISGATEGILAAVRDLESAGIETKQLQVSHAFHSSLMEPIMVEFEEIAKQITGYQPQIKLISNLTGQVADGKISTAEYWREHIRQPVRFYQGMQTLNSLGYQIFLEIGPKPVLLGMGRECLLGTEEKKMWLPSLRLGKQDWRQMLPSLAQLYVRGVKVDWSGFEKGYAHNRVMLPTYPWQRQGYWITALQQHKQITQPGEIRLPDLNLISAPEAKEPEKSAVESIAKRKLVPLTPTQPANSNFNWEGSGHQPVVPERSPVVPERSRRVVAKSPGDISQIEATLKEKLAAVLYVDSSQIEVRQKFIDLGLDSIMGVEWIKTINQTYGLQLKTSKLYDYPTLLDLAEYIAMEMEARTGTLLPPVNEVPGNFEADLRKNLRAILNRVGKNELTVQAANKMIQALKEGSQGRW